ncbi:MAG: hypothetical protein L0220_26950 [Acidobacteria bacterium]|nr:hypothetical protein [Acidobacteriota bacterium]
MMAFYGSAILYLYPKEKWRFLILPFVVATGIGMVFSITRAVIEGLLRIQSSFVRTPKYNVRRRSDNWLKVGTGYRRKKGVTPLFELAFACYFAFTVKRTARMVKRQPTESHTAAGSRYPAIASLS